ncbi:MAG: hypothetical protein IT558_03195 [Alphaproteobacteria bacterium]|nr:hypothetical protein [Alphaproteobacteria bacterium]
MFTFRPALNYRFNFEAVCPWRFRSLEKEMVPQVKVLCEEFNQMGTRFGYLQNILTGGKEREELFQTTMSAIFHMPLSAPSDFIQWCTKRENDCKEAIQTLHEQVANCEELMGLLVHDDETRRKLWIHSPTRVATLKNVRELEQTLTEKGKELQQLENAIAAELQSRGLLELDTL